MKEWIRNHKALVITISIILVCWAFIVGSVVNIYFATEGYINNPHITTDIADYGNYTGNLDNESVAEYINSFFPEKIEDNFTDISYSYRAQKGDAYAYEAYLEFVIEDTDEYNAFVAEYTEGLTGTIFEYDEAFTDYTIDQQLSITVWDDSGKEVYLFSDIALELVKMGKILCCDDEQRIIFVAIGVWDGGMVNADLLCTYFNRFAINPLDIAEYVNYNKPSWED